jgi:hypothetical protein
VDPWNVTNNSVPFAGKRILSEAAMPSKGVFLVNSPNVKYTDDFIEADYDYQITKVESNGDVLMVSSSSFSFSAFRNMIFN